MQRQMCGPDLFRPHSTRLPTCIQQPKPVNTSQPLHIDGGAILKF